MSGVGAGGVSAGAGAGAGGVSAGGAGSAGGSAGARQRVALHSVVREGAEVGYDEAHATVPDELLASFARVGIHDWTIWRSGRDLFHVVDCDDFVAAMTALDSDPANDRWQGFIGPFVDHFVTTVAGPAGMLVPEVWRLTVQRAAVR